MSEALAMWMEDYNTGDVRPHSGLGNLTPAAYAKLRRSHKEQRERGAGYVGAPRPAFITKPSGSMMKAALVLIGG